jgi:hypothetical protein
VYFLQSNNLICCPGTALVHCGICSLAKLLELRDTTGQKYKDIS